MARKEFLLILVLAATFSTLRAGAQPAPPTARQALLDMFFSKTPGTLEKHLPEVTRAAMPKSSPGSAPSALDMFTLLSSQLQTRGQELQTFEAGPTLLAIADSQNHTKFEISVERDDLTGETDEIELGFHGYKDGQSQTAGVTPRLTLAMKQEKGVWRLYDVTVSVQVSLTDPEFLKALATRMNSTPGAMTSASVSGPGGSSIAATSGANQAAAIGGIRTLTVAEISYASAYPGRGFTCTLSELGGMGSGSGPDEHRAMLIDPRLASGRKNGYIFKLSGCDGSPASRFMVTAAPADATQGTVAFCSDQSGVVRSSPDGDGAACLSSGKPVQ